MESRRAALPFLRCSQRRTAKRASTRQPKRKEIRLFCHKRKRKTVKRFVGCCCAPLEKCVRRPKRWMIHSFLFSPSPLLLLSLSLSQSLDWCTYAHTHRQTHNATVLLMKGLLLSRETCAQTLVAFYRRGPSRLLPISSGYARLLLRSNLSLAAVLTFLSQHARVY